MSLIDSTLTPEEHNNVQNVKHGTLQQFQAHFKVCGSPLTKRTSVPCKYCPNMYSSNSARNRHMKITHADRIGSDQ